MGQHRDLLTQPATMTAWRTRTTPKGYMQQIEAMLQPQRIRATLSFAGLHQITHEIIKQSVPEEVRLFYRQGFDETGWQYDEEEYKRRVRSGAPKDRFRAVFAVACRLRGDHAVPS